MCRLGVRLLTNPGTRDFLVIEESLVFSCPGIIRWCRDIMLRWIPDPIHWVLQLPPLPLTSRPCPKLSPQAFPFFLYPSVLFPWGVIYASHTISSPALPLNTSPPIYVVNITSHDNVWQTCMVWSCLILIWLLQLLTSWMACLCTWWLRRTSVFFQRFTKYSFGTGMKENHSGGRKIFLKKRF